MMRVIFILLLFLSGLAPAQTDTCASKGARSDAAMYRVTPVKFNSENAEFAPMVNGDEIFFVSTRNELTAVAYNDHNGSSATTDIFKAVMSDSLQARRTDRLPAPINNKYHQGPFCFSKDLSRVIYTSNNEESPYPKLFQSYFENGRWKEGTALAFCVDTFMYCHPYLSVGGDTLWFASNFTGTRGNYDIFYSKLQSDKWSTPVNAGDKINTSSVESYPRLSGNKLIFASNRPGGFGKLDLYSVKLPDSAIAHYPKPINSEADDFAADIDRSGEKGYFSSDRNKRNSDDIFFLQRLFPDFSDAIPLVSKSKFCYTFFDSVSHRLKDTAHYRFEWTFGDGHKGSGAKTRHCYENPGQYHVELVISKKSSGRIVSRPANYDINIKTPKDVRINMKDTVLLDACNNFYYEVQGFSDPPSEVTWFFGDHAISSDNTPYHAFRKPGEYTVSLFLKFNEQQQNAENPRAVTYVKRKKVIVAGRGQ